MRNKDEEVYSPEHGVGTVIKEDSTNESKSKKKALFEDGEIREVDENCSTMIND